MKKIILLGLLVVAGLIGFAQQQDSILPPYLKVPFIPPFKLLQTNDTNFTKDSMPAKRPVVIMYYSPDCGHCQVQIQNLVDSMSFVKKAFFVLAAYKPIKQIAEFEEKYKLKDFDNIRTGRDTKYFIPSFYKVRFTPFTAVYDKKGNFLKAYELGFTVKELSELLN